ncbi:GTPase family protein, putative [Babesia bigemina]|uniref:GTPase family protein, putative n=1 Tax=Babesia bigemina TaxID=5866 RepID=A0A061D5S3_BABBI|nr:GTPase family protein, putative [Babesia bigemina]CDR95903.1 GTPase family protein, putative [Babesia bigemina]|eukprot:XP_012768089.1 GTPase family protein, putative [Babesia bigemina]
MIVRGGRGGKGNRYYMSKFNPAPYVCERGEEGVTREIVLNYKIIGHVALIGKPNSGTLGVCSFAHTSTGKSSLLRCLSNARPRVADYAFSTKFPIMGMLDVDEFVDRSAEMDNVIDGDEPDVVDRVDDLAVVDTTNSEEIEYAPTDSTYSDVINDIDGFAADNDKIGDISSDNYVMGEETDTRSDDADSVDANRSNSQSSAMMCMYGYRCSPQLQSRSDDAHDDMQRHVAGSSAADRVHSSEDGGTVLRGVHVKRVSPQSVPGNPSDSASDTYYGYSSSYESAYDSEDDSTMYSNGSHDDHGSEDGCGRECTNGSFDTGANIAEMCGLATGDDASSKRRQLTIADVPGLIEGASAGRGLGHQFLKHIENSNVLAYVVDGSLEDPLADYHDVRNEVGLYNEALLSRLELVLINKIDLIDESRVRELVDQFKQECNHDRVYAISAKTRQNMDEIKKTFANIYQEHTDNSNRNHEPMDAAIDDPNDFRKLNPRKFKVEQVAEGEFRIKSDYLERKIPMMRFEYRETLDKLRRILRTNRIHYKLRRMGVKAGDTVHVGGMSFCVDELAY